MASVVASVNNVDMEEVACGMSHTLLLDRSGTVWSMGEGEQVLFSNYPLLFGKVIFYLLLPL